MSLKLNTSSGGSITLQEADTASNLTITVPAVTGTMLTTASTFAGTGPAFRAVASGSQSITSGTFTKVALNTDSGTYGFDTNNNFDAVTNYRFTPTVAGYYQINGSITFSGSITRALISIYKNGSQYSRQTDVQGFTSTNLYLCVSDLIYMNGTTDYLELYGFAIGTSLTFNNPTASEQSNMSGCLVRAA